MISLLGNITLSVALFFSLMQSLPVFWGYIKNQPHLLALARPALFAQSLLVSMAYLLLTLAFATNDFSIAYVAQNSHSTLPLMYRLTALWGGHEGSILLWVFLLSLWSLGVSFAQKNPKESALSLAILGSISSCFLGFLLFTSDPFQLASLPMSGHDLNPLLQDPGFVIHPPMLYSGYVGFSAAFALTLAALIRGKLTIEWAALTRRFALVAWSFLTLGITLGSWWAYRVLGWGGFWFWDPVENASLLPWLAGTALIHLLVLSEKKQLGQSWAALLAIICFSLSVLGTFLVRSGVLISAHTFASDPKRGLYLLILLAILLTIALFIYILKLPTIKTTAYTHFSLFSREASLLLNSVFLMVAMLTILLGTLYPLLLETLGLGAISVGAPYFNTVMMPMAFLILFFMALAPICGWQHVTLQMLWQQSFKKVLVSCIISVALLAGVMHHIDLSAALALTLSIWVILSAFSAKRSLPGMTLAHTGFAILIIGILLSSFLHQEKEARLSPGETVALGPYHFLFLDTQAANGSNYRGIRAAFDVTKNAKHITNLYPEKRIYTVRDMVMTNVAIHPSIFRDLYVALGEPLDENAWSIRFYYKPFIRWIWLGGILMLIGGMLTALQRLPLRKKHVTT